MFSPEALNKNVTMSIIMEFGTHILFFTWHREFETEVFYWEGGDG